MPELPEVQTTVDGLSQYILGKQIEEAVFYRGNIRYTLEPAWKDKISKQTIHTISRRAKLIIMRLDRCYLLWHLGMTGSMRICPKSETRRKHDHIELSFDNGMVMRFHDPRRFGYMKLFDNIASLQQSISHYGPEPLSDEFNADYLWQYTRHKSGSVKNIIMNQKAVVGVGNIYACEALFMAGVSPKKAANKISKVKYGLIVKSIKSVLNTAIAMGGTTLKDFENAEAKPGYFQQQLLVYGRANQPCTQCQNPIKSVMLSGRNSFYCPKCQI